MVRRLVVAQEIESSSLSSHPLFRVRSMVGCLVLTQVIGVQVPGPEPDAQLGELESPPACQAGKHEFKSRIGRS